ncbi:MAG: hypothetical protein A2539_09730 [Elusimicrobia bacterium RIFOXYD2_FULL_34_15]|nr:MAG: hypothetical protein A2539_09730 [Elusimicrobia bacterium RIFOXYD2_FULL_34_15]
MDGGEIWIYNSGSSKLNLKRNIIICIILMLTSITLSVYIKKDSSGSDSLIIFSQDFTLKELAEKNNVPVKEILHILSHADPAVWDVARNRPIKTIIKNPDAVKNAVEHIKGDVQPSKDIAKYISWTLYLSLILLLIFSRKHIKKIRVWIMVLTVLVFGLILGANPNPMESSVKLFKLFNSMKGSPNIVVVSFILFTFFSIMGSKFMCSWGCQLGALQECLFNIPVFKRKHEVKVPFSLSFGLRIVIFIIFFILLFGFGYGVVFGIKDFVVYHHLNYFKIFDFHELAAIAFYSLPIFILSSFFIFRPFCHYICPFGLYSWLLENVALNKIRINEKKCIQCEKCINACPTEAMKYIYNHKRKYFLPDCWSCGNCIDVCPVDAIEYRGSGT